MHTQSLEEAQTLWEYLTRAEELCKKVQSLLISVRGIAVPESDSESNMLRILNGNVDCVLRLLQIAIQGGMAQETRQDDRAPRSGVRVVSSGSVGLVPS